MQPSPRCAWIAFLIATTAGCSSSTEPEPQLTGFDILFELYPALDHDLRLVDRTLTVEGWILAPCISYNATAAVLAIADQLELVVAGKRTGQCPFDAINQLSYRAVIEHLPAGELHVTVHHTWLDVSSWPDTTVMVATIVVP